MGIIKKEDLANIYAPFYTSTEYNQVRQERLQRREEVAELMIKLDVAHKEIKMLRRMLDREQIRRWYKGALIREEDKTDPDGFAKEAIEEIVHYLDAEEILADISPFCKRQLEMKKTQQSR